MSFDIHFSKQDKDIAMKAVLVAAKLLILIAFLCSASFAEDLAGKVSSRLEAVELGGHEIDIATDGSDVKLSGWVSSEKDRDAIISAIRSMDGVGKVKDELEINSGVIMDDRSVLAARVEEVKAAAEKYMLSVKPRGKFNFQFEIDEEGVLIKGSVPPGIEPQALLYNVKREVSTPVREQIYVRPWPSDEELLIRVKSSLKDRQGLNMQGIEISVANGLVTLKGRRATHEEVDQLAAAVLMVEGIREFKSEMVYP